MGALTEPEDMQRLDGSQNGDAVEIEVPAITAPTLPVEHTVTNCATFYQRTIGGGIQVKFVPVVATPNGNVPAPEAYVILFSAEGWAAFQREVAAGGVKAPQIHLPETRTFGGGPL